MSVNYDNLYKLLFIPSLNFILNIRSLTTTQNINLCFQTSICQFAKSILEKVKLPQ